MRLRKPFFCLLLSCLLLVRVWPCPASAQEDFASSLTARFEKPGLPYGTEVRWWMAEGAHTDETLLEEIQAMYDAGFRGMELCEQVDTSVSDGDYGYGSDQWDHDLKLVLNRALDLGMTVSLTSGTNWATANIPGLDPHSQAASQTVFEIDEYLKAGKAKDGKVPMEKKQGVKVIPVQENARFLGAYAYRQTSGKKATPILFDPEFIDLTEQIVTGEDGSRTLSFTPPDPDSAWRIFYYWQQGAEQFSSPAAEPACCINYFDEAGVRALRAYWEEHILNDAALNEKIKAGDVQLFMDSLEINPGSGFTFWAQDMEQEFMKRKGYDIRPYLYLFIDLPEMWFYDHAGFGTYDLDGSAEERTRIQNDLFDVQTQLYTERMLTPLRTWLEEAGIQTRAQISYGQHLEISEPIAAVTYPEMENLNQNNQIDIYRLWTGGAKLQNKPLSSETGAVGGHRYTYQDHLMEAYTQYAAGASRIIWHVWSAKYGPGEETKWPGYRVPGAVFNSFYTFGQSEPSARDYPVFNDHLGRIQKLLQTGVSRTDVGMLYQTWDQGMPTNGNQGGVNWMLNHVSPLFPSTALQDAGYTYDYFSPRFLTADGVRFDPQKRTLEQAGYKALVLWQDSLAVEDAKAVLALAEQGMPVIVVDGAAMHTPFHDGGDQALSGVMEQLRASAVCVADADAVLPALQEMGIAPYGGFSAPNRQLLTQAREDENARYLYVYNYCDGSYQGVWSNGEMQDSHGDTISTEIVSDGLFVPYTIDPWTGRAQKMGLYRHEDGKTVFPVSLSYNNVGLYALEPCTEETLHAVSADADRVWENGTLVFRYTETGDHAVILSDGQEVTLKADVPAAAPVTGWQVNLDIWTAGDTRSTRTETLHGKTVTETAVDTVITPVSLTLDTLTGWDQMPGVGPDAVGQATYTAAFQWDGQADGAYLDFGSLVESMTVYVNGQKTEDVSMTRPILDLGAWLKTGENTVELRYATNVSNALGDGVPRGWWGYHTEKHSYGPQQALLIPYIDLMIRPND